MPIPEGYPYLGLPGNASLWNDLPAREGRPYLAPGQAMRASGMICQPGKANLSGLEGRPYLAPGQAMRALASVDAARGGGTIHTAAERCGTRHGARWPRPNRVDRSIVDPRVGVPVPMVTMANLNQYRSRFRGIIMSHPRLDR